ncbi:hypothetical protein [Desulfopila inferna]|uniref:hypothetical protein n=1 Tax=Desulfopila inferna TaxID=468528 RepID=UPI0019649566|nr:hypothetical protein [Desulfopila inferna]MBM9603427.1 hypothetical protein [Desulfopila inferna]
MAAKKSHISMSHYFFIFLLTAGLALLFYTFFNAQDEKIFSGLRQIALGITLIGIGEWINHPLQKSVTYKERKDFIFQKIRHRKRNPSVLGNLFEIGGLLLIFTGLADYV